MGKEQIIIDGVDVKNCKGIDLSLSPLVKCKSLKFKTSDGGIAGIWCSDHTNCYFKQLARKTQELEVICKAFDIEYAYNDDGKIFGRSNKLRSLEQECEELKKDLQDYESWFDEYKILFTYDGRTPVTNDELYTCLEELVKKGNDETNHYHKALEEIEKVINNILNSCLGRNTVGCRPAHNVCGDLIKILDIINKVKEEENE